MWKAALVTLGLLMTLVGRVKSDEGHPSFYRVKLCGREFIRAVIFTCGGSRWRRRVEDSGVIEEEAFDPWNPDPVSQFPSDQHPAKPQMLKDQKMDVAPEAAGFGRLVRSATLEEVLEAFRNTARKGRDVEVGLSNACCKWGCSKSEISSLC
ncbi:relaxin-3-like [Genypterus blacodes]|uniref:relaxin-3-like n=1 Tax=Genypterus blacodes TaxID=154954 RepID=UPI003F760F59